MMTWEPLARPNGRAPVRTAVAVVPWLVRLLTVTTVSVERSLLVLPEMARTGLLSRSVPEFLVLLRYLEVVNELPPSWEAAMRTGSGWSVNDGSWGSVGALLTWFQE